MQSLLKTLFSFLFFCVFLNSIDAHPNPVVHPEDTDTDYQYKRLFPNLGNPDSIGALLGHCQAVIFADTNCLTQTIELSAFVSWTFTGQLEPMTVTWNTGEIAHKITVTPPGLWNWDASITGCEPNHWHNEYDQPGSFFSGNLEILGPTSICLGDIAELTVESGGYDFPDYSWDPPTSSGSISPYEISAPGIYTLSVTDALGCSFTDQVNIVQSPATLVAVAQTFCPGGSVTIGGQVYNQSGTVFDTIPSVTSGCDTIVTYTLTLLPYQTRAENISFCPGETIVLGGIAYTQPGTVMDTLSAISGCDTIVTYTLTLVPNHARSESISLCPGESVTIGGQVYTQSATVVDTIAATSGCDTIVTYTLTLLPQPTRAETIAFCPGETILLGGTNYTQPGTVVLTLPSTTIGCDTIVTYTLHFLTPTPSNVSIHCPSSITLNTGNSGAAVNYSAAIAASSCPCPGIAIDLTSGLSSGSIFPLGVTSVCYTAADSCGQSASCCFNVTVEEDDDEACDTKVNGCLKYELLTITEDAGKNRTYRIRVTNNCPSKLLYTVIQVPTGIVAIEPANFSTYTAPSGNTYLVRNPNFTHKYSIRYSSNSDSINNGESDIFKYTLPAQANVTFIHVIARLTHNIYLETHLNTFYCPIGITPTAPPPRWRTQRENRFDNPGFFEISKS